MDLIDQALALGTPDDRPELLQERYAALGGDRSEPVHAAAERLAGSIPLTVAHMEAHDGNIFVRDGQPVFIDWAEAVVTHPFVGPLLTLRSATERSGYEPGSPKRDEIPASIRSSPGGYRTYHFWHSGYHGGK